MQELEHLKKLVLEGGWDEESRQQVRDLESRFQRLVATEKLAEHPVMAEYMAYLRSEITRCKELLSEDDKLTDIERTKLFERIHQSREFLERLDPKSRTELEKTIKELLARAKSL
jgi:hypothetical protein